ncbi:hypothetical protein NC651_018752 [Populus alba x Populus x berolinensis]|nr:hypothetical protein NC651_018752 [Populus alba x Populus x berolinensis]
MLSGCPFRRSLFVLVELLHLHCLLIIHNNRYDDRIRSEKTNPNFLR